MPFKFYPPKAGRSPFYRVRGAEFGIRINRSTQTGDKREAERFLSKWRDEAKRQALEKPKDKKEPITFAKAATSYMHADRPKRFLAPLIRHFALTPIVDIDQAAIDAAAKIIYPDASPATRNRQVYSPVSAILRHAGVALPLRRPKGAQGNTRKGFLSQKEAFALLGAANALHPRFGALLTFLLYTGVRLSEALRLNWENVDLDRSTASILETKNGNPVTVHLPSYVTECLENLPRGPRVFGFSKSGRIYNLLADAELKAGLVLPPRTAFHILRHTHATWRRLHTGADTTALTQTGLWKSRNAAAVYEHVDATAESRKSDLLPVPPHDKRMGRKEKN